MPSRFHFEPGTIISKVFPEHRWNIHFGIPQRPIPGFVIKGFMLLENLGRMLLQTGGRMKMEADTV